MRIEALLLGCSLLCASVLASAHAAQSPSVKAPPPLEAPAPPTPQVIKVVPVKPQVEEVQAPPAPQVIRLVPLTAQAPPELMAKAANSTQPSSPAAQPAKSNTAAAKSEATAAKSEAPSAKSDAATAKPDAPPTFVEADSPRVRQSNDDYAVWRNEYLRRLYENQLRESWIIFVLVLLLVFAGLFFSWLQFQHAFLLSKVVKSSAATQVDPNATPNSTPDEVTFGKDGVVIKSAYLGVIILVISMAFFFLYIKYVYLIT